MLNKCCFIGRVGRDPEIRTTQAGKKIANLSLGVSEKYKDVDGQKQEKTEWVNVGVFNDGLVSVVESYVKKGQLLYIEGKFQTRKWQDKDGQDRYTTEILLAGYNGQLVMLSKSEGEQQVKHDAPAIVDDEDEIPF